MKSWKTTLAGILAGVSVMVGGAVQNRQANPSAPPVTLGNVLPAVALAILGGMSKDYDKTNAPVPAPTQPTKPE